MARQKSSLFENLEESLNDALAYAKRKPKSGTRTVVYREAKQRSALQIKKLRRGLGQTQAEFAGLLSVSVKTVEAWEAGTKHPTGPALRLFELLESYSIRLDKNGKIDLKRKAG